MPANQLITQPREETDMRILIADADTMPYTYHLRDVFSETVGRISSCKQKGIMFRFLAIYDPIGRTPKTGMVAVDPKLIISVREEPKVAD